MIEQTCCDNAVELAFLRKDAEDWKRRASLAEAESQRLRDALQDKIADYHTAGIASLTKQLEDEKARRVAAETNLERVRGMRIRLGHQGEET